LVDSLGISPSLPSFIEMYLNSEISCGQTNIQITDQKATHYNKVVENNLIDTHLQCSEMVTYVL